MPSFKWDDPFFLDDQLTEEEVLIRDTARDYAQEKLQTRVKQALPRRVLSSRNYDGDGGFGPARFDDCLNSTVALA